MEAQASSTMLGETGKRVAASVSDHWKPPPPSPSRVKVYDEDKLAMLLGDAPPPSVPGGAMGRTRSIHAALRAQQRSEKKRQARESETKRRPRAVVRETLEITSWGAGKIEATPHGYFAKLMDEAKPPAGDKGKSKTFESNIPFDHYNVSVGSAATDKEFPVGKRTHHVPTTIKLA